METNILEHSYDQICGMIHEYLCEVTVGQSTPDDQKGGILHNSSYRARFATLTS